MTTASLGWRRVFSLFAEVGIVLADALWRRTVRGDHSAIFHLVSRRGSEWRRESRQRRWRGRVPLWWPLTRQAVIQQVLHVCWKRHVVCVARVVFVDGKVMPRFTPLPGVLVLDIGTKPVHTRASCDPSPVRTARPRHAERARARMDAEAGARAYSYVSRRCLQTVSSDCILFCWLASRPRCMPSLRCPHLAHSTPACLRHHRPARRKMHHQLLHADR